MKKKVLKNIPKPDEDKLALFYGKNTSEEKINTLVNNRPIEANKTSAVNMSTVDNMSSIVKTAVMRAKEKFNLTFSQTFIYDYLIQAVNDKENNTTDLLGYRDIAKKINISLKSVQRAIEKLMQQKLIARVELFNSGQRKGSKYKVFIPNPILTTVDNMSTEDSLPTNVNLTTEHKKNG